MLKIKNIYKSFGEQKVLKGVSFELEKGKVYTLVGGNGSGKTTLFNIITGFLRPDLGTIEFKNQILNHRSPVEINNLGVARTFQDLRIIKNITVRENILLALRRNHSTSIFSEFKNFNKKNYIRVDEIIDQVSLTQEKDSLADEISFGQQKLLTIGCCLSNNSEVLLLDEPIAGIDKDNYQKIKSLIEQLSKEANRYILQIEHNLDFIKETSNFLVFLDAGKESVFDNYYSFSKDENVKRTYLN
jgi:ABC-type branched-subunit amino acid transport system ATPase component